MKAILIDDERHALLQLQWLLEKESDIAIVGSYQTAAEGIAHLRREPVDLVFLDMEMPGMSGLEAAAALADPGGGPRVVFVTAYASYALEAFEVNALDYVLKPIDPIRFAKTLARIRETLGGDAGPPEVQPERYAVQTFGQFAIAPAAMDGAKLRWRTLKSKELFAYMLQHRDRWLPRGLLLEELWPAYEADKALVHLHTAVYQVRQALKSFADAASLDYSLESYRLAGGGLESDADLFERDAEKALSGAWTPAAYESALKCWTLYRGHYLEQEDFGWAQPRAERLLQAYVELAERLVRHELKEGKAGMALRRARRSCELAPFSEQMAASELHCLLASGDTAGMKRKYETFYAYIERELGEAPSEAFRQAYAALAGA
ncbi:response regulator [Cohnella sp. 56]|uniref:response regulator n=1 Tax=Cohnella sp. 56 TaxID=3113722 RepID=UPI0030E8B450